VGRFCSRAQCDDLYQYRFAPTLQAQRPTGIASNVTALTQLTGVVAVAVAGYSPFHLLWLFPVSYFTGFFALRSRIGSRLAWLYGYVVAYTIPSKWVSSTALDRTPLAKLRRVLKGTAKVQDVTNWWHP
jgi:hypothetical protein